MTDPARICSVPECGRGVRQQRLCRMHLRQVSNGQEPTWLGQKPLAWWEVCEEIEFLMSYGMSTVAITEALKTSYESLTQRLREHDNAKPILQNLMARRNQEIGREPAAH